MEKDKFIKDVKEVENNFNDGEFILNIILSWMKESKANKLFIPGKYLTIEDNKILVNGIQTTEIKAIQDLYYDVREVFIRALFNS